MAGRFQRQQTKKPGRQAPPGVDPLAAPMEPGGSQGLPIGPTSPAATADLAAGGEKIARGQSPAQPMTPEGHAKIAQVGQDLAKAGGPTKIVASTSRRAQESANDVNAQLPNPVPVQPDPGLESQNMGMVEGAPKTPELKKFLADLIRKGPGFRIPGQGALAGKPGETWDEFRVRGLKDAVGLLQMVAQDPKQVIVAPTSTHTIKLVEAYTDKGTPDDLSVSPDTYLKEGTIKPGDMFRWGPSGPDGKLTFTKINPQDAGPGAVNFLAHGETAASTNPNPTDMQRQRAQIVKHTLTRNWKGLDTAAKAATRSGMSDQELSSAIDEALPSAQDAQGLSNHDLMAVHSAASPAKRQELLPVMKQRFAPEALAALPPHAGQALKSHLGRIGAL